MLTVGSLSATIDFPALAQIFTLITLLALLVVVALVLKELVIVRRQVSSIRQSLEWFAVGFLEKKKDGLAPAVREYMENAKQDLIREGRNEGTVTEQQIHELFQNAEEKDDVGEIRSAGSKGGSTEWKSGAAITGCRYGAGSRMIKQIGSAIGVNSRTEK